MHYFSKEMLGCRPPSNIYTLFLQEKLYEFQLSRLKDQFPHNLDMPQELTEALQQCYDAEKGQLSEFHLHILVTPTPYKCSLNSYVRDFHLRALTPWMIYEVLREEAFATYHND